jgi:hypothetical protein
MQWIGDCHFCYCQPKGLLQFCRAARQTCRAQIHLISYVRVRTRVYRNITDAIYVQPTWHQLSLTFSSVIHTYTVCLCCVPVRSWKTDDNQHQRQSHKEVYCLLACLLLLILLTVNLVLPARSSSSRSVRSHRYIHRHQRFTTTIKKSFEIKSQP